MYVCVCISIKIDQCINEYITIYVGYVIKHIPEDISF